MKQLNENEENCEVEHDSIDNRSNRIEQIDNPESLIIEDLSSGWRITLGSCKLNVIELSSLALDLKDKLFDTKKENGTNYLG